MCRLRCKDETQRQQFTQLYSKVSPTKHFYNDVSLISHKEKSLTFTMKLFSRRSCSVSLADVCRCLQMIRSHISVLILSELVNIYAAGRD